MSRMRDATSCRAFDVPHHYHVANRRLNTAHVATTIKLNTNHVDTATIQRNSRFPVRSRPLLVAQIHKTKPKKTRSYRLSTATSPYFNFQSRRSVAQRKFRSAERTLRYASERFTRVPAVRFPVRVSTSHHVDRWVLPALDVIRLSWSPHTFCNAPFPYTVVVHHPTLSPIMLRPRMAYCTIFLTLAPKPTSTPVTGTSRLVKYNITGSLQLVWRLRSSDFILWAPLASSRCFVHRLTSHLASQDGMQRSWGNALVGPYEVWISCCQFKF